MNQEGTSVVGLLKSDKGVCEYLGQDDPQAVLMPFSGEKERKYLMVALYVSELNLTKGYLYSLTQQVLRLFRANSVLRGLDGLEIMPCFMVNGRPQRQFRFSILSESLDAAEKLDLTSFFQAEPATGITCIVYNRTL